MKPFLIAVSIALSLIGIIFRPVAEETIEVAITIDDLPASNMEFPGHTRLEIAEKMIRIFQKYKITEVYGFVNGIVAKNMPERLQILKMWKDAGFKFGNHTFSHKNLLESSAADYIRDIEDNESLLIDYASQISELKIFRYPYLQEGETKEKRYAVRSYFARRGYKIAPVTLDFEDWAWGPAYIRCSTKGSHSKISEIQSGYQRQALDRLKFSHTLAKRVYGRSIRQILLLHIIGVTADSLEKLIESYQKEGVKFISLEEALKDEIYKEDTAYIHENAENFLLQAKDSRHLTFRDLPLEQLPKTWLEGLCL